MEQFPAVEMTVFETILARRSVRDYLPREVDLDTINILLEAAVKAPCSKNQEALGFVIIQNEALLRRIAESSISMHSNVSTYDDNHHIGYQSTAANAPALDVLHNAGTLVLICANTLASHYIADCWLAAENFMLAATAMGLGTCIVSGTLAALQLPEYREALSITENGSIIVPIVLGYAATKQLASIPKKPFIISTLT